MFKKVLIIIVIVLIGGFLYSKYEAKAPSTTEESPTITPTHITTPKATADNANIHIFSPKADAVVGTNFMIIGEARVFENQFSYRVRDEDGAILASGNDYANAPDVGQYGSFGISISNLQPKGKRGTVEIYDHSAKDGSEIDLVKIPVVFKL